jgi:hypothetical protein
MSSLRELQAQFRRALLADAPAEIVHALRADGLPPAARLDIYRNSVFASLTSVLMDSFPVVCRLVDERFFRFAADAFIRAHPPEKPCLSAYGDRFPDFLAAFSPCRDLAYLPDVARLEWLMNLAAHAPEQVPLSPTVLASVSGSDVPGLIVRLDASHGYLQSPWPVDRIWSNNRSDVDAGPEFDLGDRGDVRLEVRRLGNDVVRQSLDPGTFAFRTTLANALPLAEAVVAGMAADPRFDPAAALGRLFGDRAIIGIALASPEASPIASRLIP